MRLVLFLLPSFCLAQPTVSGVVADQVTHSSFRVSYVLSGCLPNNGQIKYGLTSSYGAVQNVYFGNGVSGTQLAGALSGLTPSTLYHYAVEGSCDGGTTWTTLDVDHTQSTSSLPAVHPAFPIGPPSYAATFPNISGYLTATVSGATDCSDVTNGLQALINTAVSNQHTDGTVITVPNNFNCSNPGKYSFPLDTDSHIHAFTSANVSGNVINDIGHGYSNNQQVILSCSIVASDLPNSYTGALPAPLQIGFIYYVIVVDANHYSLSLTSGGSAIALSDTGTASGFKITQWPPYNRNSIVITGATLDSQFVPAGVRVTPAWSSVMPKITAPTGGTGPGPNGMNNTIVFSTAQFTHDIWIQKLYMTQADGSALAAVTNDPIPTLGYISLLPDNSFVTFDRDVIDGLGPPNRQKWWLNQWTGQYQTIQNSYIFNLSNPVSVVIPTTRQASSGMLPTLASPTLSFAAGSVKLLNGTNCVTTGFSYTNTSGAANSTGYVEVGLDCTPTLIIPTGATATCAGSVNGHACAIVNQASPAFTLDANGAYKNFKLASITIAGGTWTGINDYRGTINSLYNTEGVQSVYMFEGMGPVYFINNYFDCLGDCLHMDDQAKGRNGAGTTGTTPPSGYLYKRNYFYMRLNSITGQPGSDGYNYGYREPSEHKMGTNILYTGNTFFGGQRDNTPYGCVLWSSNSSLLISDIEFAYNTYQSSPCVAVFISVPHSVLSSCCKGSGLSHLYIHDNVAEDINAYAYFSFQNTTFATGNVITLGYSTEDIRICCNTFVDVRGSAPEVFHHTGWPQEGTLYYNNIFWGNNDNSGNIFSYEGGGSIPNCVSLNGKAAMDCTFTFGPANTSYQYLKNFLVPQYTNSNLLTGDANSAITTAYTGLSGAVVVSGVDPPTRVINLSFVKYANGTIGNDFRFAYNGTYTHAGVDSSTPGANMGALRRAQGVITGLNVNSITSTSFKAQFWYPDTVFGAPCTVIYGASGGSLPTLLGRVTDSSTTFGRNVSITGLTTNTAYDWYVGCNGSTGLVGPFTVRTN